MFVLSFGGDDISPCAIYLRFVEGKEVFAHVEESCFVVVCMRAYAHDLTACGAVVVC